MQTFVYFFFRCEIGFAPNKYNWFNTNTKRCYLWPWRVVVVGYFSFSQAKHTQIKWLAFQKWKQKKQKKTKNYGRENEREFGKPNQNWPCLSPLREMLEPQRKSHKKNPQTDVAETIGSVREMREKLLYSTSVKRWHVILWMFLCEFLCGSSIPRPIKCNRY